MQQATWLLRTGQTFLSQSTHAVRMDERGNLADTYEPRSS